MVTFFIEKGGVSTSLLWRGLDYGSIFTWLLFKSDVDGSALDTLNYMKTTQACLAKIIKFHLSKIKI